MNTRQKTGQKRQNTDENANVNVTLKNAKNIKCHCNILSELSEKLGQNEAEKPPYNHVVNWKWAMKDSCQAVIDANMPYCMVVHNSFYIPNGRIRYRT